MTKRFFFSTKTFLKSSLLQTSLYGNETAFVMYHTADDFSTPFYAQQFPYKEVWSREDFRNVLAERENLLVITPQHGIDEMNADSIPFEIIQQKKSFRMAKLNFKFLNPETRDSVCNRMYLVSVKEKK